MSQIGNGSLKDGGVVARQAEQCVAALAEESAIEGLGVVVIDSEATDSAATFGDLGSSADRAEPTLLGKFGVVPLDSDPIFLAKHASASLNGIVMGAGAGAFRLGVPVIAGSNLSADAVLATAQEPTTAGHEELGLVLGLVTFSADSHGGIVWARC
jgi:hypothetical protein